MSNIDLIIEERAANIGNFMVGRLLPFREKRAVGPFVFIDHMGPAHLSPEENMDIPPHPHIGLSTLTYLFEGSVMHRDSLGTEMEIKHGAVNWMTAGKGIVHSERTPQYQRSVSKTMHGLQIWVALPVDLEEMDPAFSHIEAHELPHWQEGSVSYKLIAGKAFGKQSPVPVYSSLYFIEIKTTTSASISIGKELYGECGIYILEGSIRCENNEFKPKQLMVSTQTDLCTIDLEENTTIYLFGGEPFPEQRYIHWNFVSSRKERIEQARQDWEEDRFPPVPGETERVPLPPSKIR